MASPPNAARWWTAARASRGSGSPLPSPDWAATRARSSEAAGPRRLHCVSHGGTGQAEARAGPRHARSRWSLAAGGLGDHRSPGPGRPSTRRRRTRAPVLRDRKSTRLNSSHVRISYAVFCLKKKKKKKKPKPKKKKEKKKKKKKKKKKNT